MTEASTTELSHGYFAQRVALVTGATGGIGSAIASSFADAGAKVVIHGLERQRGEESASRLRSQGTDARYIYADVGDASQCARLVEEAAEAFGRIDVLVNNAGRNVFAGVANATLEQWNSCIDVDLRAPWLLAKAALEHMPPGSAIVNIASNHAQSTLPGVFPYNVSKAGVLALTTSLAIEFAAHGIRANSISPGYVDTPINDAYFATFPDPMNERRRVEALHLVGRIGLPVDVASATLFLANTELAGFITGANLLVDGGRGTLMQDPVP